MLTRTDHGEKPLRVEYTFTPLGQSLVVHLTRLCQWAEDNLADIEQVRRDYDQKRGVNQHQEATNPE